MFLERTRGRARRVLRYFWLIAVATSVHAAPVYVAFVEDGPSAQVDGLIGQIREEIEALTVGEFDVRFEPRHAREGDWTLASVEAEIAALMGDPEVDLVIAAGGTGRSGSVLPRVARQTCFRTVRDRSDPPRLTAGRRQQRP